MRNRREIATALTRGAGALSALALLCVPVPSFALDVGVAPALIDAPVSPGAAGRVPLTITNYDPTPMTMHAYAWDYGVGPIDAKTGESTVSWFPPGTQARGASTWVTVVPDEFTIAPGGSQTVSVVMSPPADASGGYYAIVFVESGPKPDPSEVAKTVLAGRMGVKVLVRAGEAGVRDLDLEDLSVRPPTQTLPLRVELVLDNVGTLHVTPKAKAVLRSTEGGAILGRLEGESSWSFLPGQVGRLELVYPDTLPPGNYQLAGTVTYGTDDAIVLDHTFTIADEPEAAPDDVAPASPAPKRHGRGQHPAPAPAGP